MLILGNYDLDSMNYPKRQWPVRSGRLADRGWLTRRNWPAGTQAQASAGSVRLPAAGSGDRHALPVAGPVLGGVAGAGPVIANAIWTATSRMPLSRSPAAWRSW